VLHLAFLNQVFNSSRHLFDGHVRVNAMLIEQIDAVDSESLQGALDSFFDVLRPAVETY